MPSAPVGATHRSRRNVFVIIRSRLLRGDQCTRHASRTGVYPARGTGVNPERRRDGSGASCVCAGARRRRVCSLRGESRSNATVISVRSAAFLPYAAVASGIRSASSRTGRFVVTRRPGERTGTIRRFEPHTATRASVWRFDGADVLAGARRGRPRRQRQGAAGRRLATQDGQRLRTARRGRGRAGRSAGPGWWRSTGALATTEKPARSYIASVPLKTSADGTRSPAAISIG